MYKLTDKEDETIKAILQKYLDLNLHGKTTEEAKRLRGEWRKEQDPIIQAAKERTFKSYNGNIPAMLEDLKPEIVKYGLWYADHSADFEEPISYWMNEIEKEHQIYFDFIRTTSPKDFNELINFITELFNNPEPFKYYMNVDTNFQKPYINPQDGLRRSRFPKTFYRTTDKISRHLFSGKLPVNSEYEFQLEEDGRPEITSYVSIDYDNLEGVPVTFNRIEKEVFTAIINRYLQGENILTSQQIYRTTASNNKLRVSKEKAKEIDAAIKKGMACLITIDRTKAARYYKNVQSLTITGNMIAATIANEVTEDKFNGTYYIHGLPVWYQDAKDKNQVTSIPAKVMQITDENGIPVDVSDDLIVIRGYLIDWIQALKSPKNKQINNELTYQRLYELLNIDESIKTKQGILDKKSATRKKAKQILDHFVRLKYIDSYEEITEGRRKHKIKISLYSPVEGETLTI